MLPPQAPPLIALLTDFGTVDHYVGVVKGVIAGIAPGVQTIDLSHEVAAQDVQAAGCALLFGYPFFPARSIFLCIVDPGVGSQRRAIGSELDSSNGPLFVICPDNGLLTPLLASGEAAVTRVVELDDPRFHLPRPSATFHGRDVFAPTAAHLAAGVDLSDLGTASTPDSLMMLDWATSTRDERGWSATVIYVDRFGNLITNLAGSQLDAGDWRAFVTGTVDEEVPDRRISLDFPLLSTFSDVDIGSRVAYVGSSGFVELALRQGNAARELAIERGDLVRFERSRDVAESVSR